MAVHFNINRYARFWTTDREKYCLFTLKYYGNIELLIYHIPTKRVVTFPNLSIEKQIVDRMLECGNVILDDELLAQPSIMIQ